MVKDFISIIINPIWKWVVEIFMGLMSLIIYIKPEWTSELSFSNLIQKYWLIWFIVGTIIWALATAFQYVKEKAEMKKTLKSAKSNKPSESYYVESGAVGKQEAGEIKNYFGERSKKKEVAVEMGIILNSFQQHIKDVSYAQDEEMLNKLKIAHEEFYKLRDNFLSSGKAILDNSIDIENVFKSLNKVYACYAEGLKKYLYLIENNPFVNKQPSMDEINNHPYFVEKIGLGTSLRAGELLSNVNEEIENLRKLIKKNL